MVVVGVASILIVVSMVAETLVVIVAVVVAYESVMRGW